MFSGIMRPSIPSGIYFLVFMGSATAWSLGRSLERGFAVVGRCLMAIMAAHVAILVVYQCSWIIDLLPPNSEFARLDFIQITKLLSILFACLHVKFHIIFYSYFISLIRYFGLTKLVNINITDPAKFTYVVTDDHMWATLASPLVILFTYFILALETRELFKPKVRQNVNLKLVDLMSYLTKHDFSSRNRCKLIFLKSFFSIYFSSANNRHESVFVFLWFIAHNVCLFCRKKKLNVDLVVLLISLLKLAIKLFSASMFTRYCTLKNN